MSRRPRLSNTLAVRDFVNGSATLCAEAICVTITSPWCTISRIKWYLRSICFPRLWLLGSLKLATAPLLSHYSVIGFDIFGTISKLVKNFLSQTAPLVASQAATYSASMVESAIHPWLILLQTTAPPLRVNTEPEVDFLESISLKVRVCVSCEDQILRTIHKYVVPRSPKIHEDSFNGNPVS